MKRLLLLFLALTLLLSIAACGAPSTQPGTTTSSQSEPSVSDPTTTVSTAPTRPSTAPTTPSTAPTDPPHEHSYSSQQTKDPACEEDGEMTFLCGCGHSYTELVKATGHDWQEWEQTLRPTMTTTGEAKRICNVCKKEETKPLDKNTLQQEIQYFGSLIDGLPEFTDVNKLSPGFVFDWVRLQVGSVSSEWNEETFVLTHTYSLDAFNAFTACYLGRTFDFVYMTEYNDDMVYDKENNYLIWYTYGSGGGSYREMVSYEKVDDTHYVIRYASTPVDQETPSYYGLITLRLEDGKFIIESHVIEK